MNKTFSYQDRSKTIASMSESKFDLIIIGGGITGAGILLDATLRGLTCCLIEKRDFASGTSSRSTKLIHGGLRYLKQLDFKLVAEVGKERKIVSNIANHLTYPERVLLPFIKGGSLKKWPTRLALWMYEKLSNVDKIDGYKMLSKEDVFDKVPELDSSLVTGGADYVEYRTNDARLTLEVIKTAVSKGALALSYAEVNDLLLDNEKVIGVVVKDQIEGSSFNVVGTSVINATGPWVDVLRELVDSKISKKILHTKGVHFVFDKKDFQLDQAIYFDTPDKRMVFAIPRGQKVYVGTTDTYYKEQLEEPSITSEDRAYIVSAINHLFKKAKLTESAIESGWSGVRPLIYQEGKSPSEVSRKDEIFIDSNGLFNIAGGKLTGYRKMAQKIVDLVCEKHNIQTDCITDKQLLSGATKNGLEGFQQFLQQKTIDLIRLGLSEEVAVKMIRRYGSNIDKVMGVYDPEEFENSKLPKEIYLSLKYGLIYEMTLTVTDFFIRRTNAFYFNIELVNNTKKEVTTFMANYYGWSESQKVKYSQELEGCMAGFSKN